MNTRQQHDNKPLRRSIAALLLSVLCSAVSDGAAAPSLTKQQLMQIFDQNWEHTTAIGYVCASDPVASSILLDIVRELEGKRDPVSVRRRLRAVSELGSCDASVVADSLTSLLDDRSPSIQANAIRSLGRLGGHRARAGLLGKLKKSVGDVNAGPIIDALVQYRDAEAQAALRDFAAKDKREFVRSKVRGILQGR